MSSRFATLCQIDFALKLGAIESESQGKPLTKKAISRLIESAKQSRYQDLCRIYDELDFDLQRSGDILALAEKATTLKKQGYSHWYCGPCPECGGTDRFYINTKDNLFKCGHAGGTGNGCGWGGGIAQMAAYVWKCSTWDAIDSLTGQSPRKDSVITRSASTRTPMQPEKSTKEEKPYLDFSAVLRASEERLRGPDGQVGREWLVSRGIPRETWLANHVGLVIDYKRGPAVCFPHQLDVNGTGGQTVSLNRRFMDDEARLAKIERAKQMDQKIDIPKTKHINGGRWGLYHLAAVEGARTLIVIEGEINGLSVLMVVRRMGLLIDVVSVGSDGAFRALAAHISKLAKGYDTLIIWADEFEVADEASRVIEHGDIHAIRSPVFRGKELDANDFLLRGELAGFLSRVLPPTRDVAPDTTGASAASPPIIPISSTSELIAEDDNDTDDAPALPALPTMRNKDAQLLLTDAQPVRTTTPVGNIATNNLAVSAPTGSDSLLALCAELCSDVADTERARRWYLVCERHYMHGDFTSLLECTRAIQSVGKEQPNFPALSPTRPNYDEYPIIDPDDPFHRWIWAVRAVKLGHTEYLGEALKWAGLITDDDLIKQAKREISELVGPLDVEQLSLF